MSQAVHVEKNAITNAALVDTDQGPLPQGGARLEIESFSVTANNVTYAVVGDGFGYWNFFPAADGHGIVPMWGHAKVIEDNGSGLEVGERVYGYLPMATHLTVVPGKVSASGFVDTAEHRQPMSPIYNQYSRLAADPEHDPAREGERMIFGPLFKTGFLIEYFMRAGKLVRRRSGHPDQCVVQNGNGSGQRGEAELARYQADRPDLSGQCRLREGHRHV